jgi:hypothetical protein
MEINLDDLETTSGEYQAYWLLALKAARQTFSLRHQQAARRRSQHNLGYRWVYAYTLVQMI